MSDVSARASGAFLYNPFAKLETPAQARIAAKLGAVAAGVLGLISGVGLIAAIFGQSAVASQLEHSKTIVFCLFGVATAAILGIAIAKSQELWASITLAVCVSLYFTATSMERGLAAVIWTLNIPLATSTILNVRGTLLLARERTGQAQVLPARLRLLLTCGAALLMTVTGLTVWNTVTSPLKPRSSQTKQALTAALPAGSTLKDATRLLQAQGMRCQPLKGTIFQEDVSDGGKQRTRAAGDYLFCDGWNNARPQATRWQIAVYAEKSVISYIAVSTSHFRPN